MTKEDLKGYRYTCKQIYQLEMERKRLYAIAEGGSSAPNRAPVRGGQHDPLPYIMDKLTEMGMLLGPLYEQLVMRRREIERAISALDSREQWLIRARYIEGRSWEQISAEMKYSWKQVHRIHGTALKKMTHNDTL